MIWPVDERVRAATKTGSGLRRCDRSAASSRISSHRSVRQIDDRLQVAALPAEPLATA